MTDIDVVAATDIEHHILDILEPGLRKRRERRIRIQRVADAAGRQARGRSTLSAACVALRLEPTAVPAVLGRRESETKAEPEEVFSTHNPRAIEVALSHSNRVEHLFHKCLQKASFWNKR
ncbi:hypothetical protein [Cryobacterium sp. Hz9]|uniref:hypothetical protein n=1 Tax=Cryobacterium sp. Hz9 TaxID=1259167 RepID=UPI001F53EE9F|nr:hypothetical protein [Cryobacterium sp. Hz9]